jgi:multicomponent Na+:H+ antiporter subunit D
MLPMMKRTETISLDFDVLYRKGLPAFVRAFVGTFRPIDRGVRGAAVRTFGRVVSQIYRHHGPAGALARTANAGNMVFWVIVMLAGYLVIYFV